MALEDRVPLSGDGVLARNGFALLTDLDGGGYGEIVGALEAFQSEFLARTRTLWEPDFAVPPDALAHFTRQWEYPYAWANLASARGRFLDAGSGLTFFPFVFAAAGFDVDCCDGDTDRLGYRDRFARAAAATDVAVRYTECLLEDMPFPDGVFDAVACISVLEHVGPKRSEIVDSLARVLKPGGRIVITCDVDLWRTDALTIEDVSMLLTEFERHFEPSFPFDLRRPPTLLTSESFLGSAIWRLPPPWRPRADGSLSGHFRSITVLGMTGRRRDA